MRYSTQHEKQRRFGTVQGVFVIWMVKLNIFLNQMVVKNDEIGHAGNSTDYFMSLIQSFL